MCGVLGEAIGLSCFRVGLGLSVLRSTAEGF